MAKTFIDSDVYAYSRGRMDRASSGVCQPPFALEDVTGSYMYLAGFNDESVCEYPVNDVSVPNGNITLKQIREIVSAISYPEYRFKVELSGMVPYLQACYDEPDIVTGKMSEQCTRKYLLSFHMVPSEITQTALKLVLTSMEHRAREHFLYKGERVYGPHFDVEALVEIARAKRLDYRGKKKDTSAFFQTLGGKPKN